MRGNVARHQVDRSNASDLVGGHQPHGKFWAAGSWRGDVRVWHEGGQRLHLVWQAHTENTFTLAFSPDERTLATGSWDGTVKLWDLQSGALLWTAWHPGPIYSVAFAPDGRTLASGGRGCPHPVLGGVLRQAESDPGESGWIQ